MQDFDEGDMSNQASTNETIQTDKKKKKRRKNKKKKKKKADEELINNAEDNKQNDGVTLS